MHAEWCFWCLLPSSPSVELGAKHSAEEVREREGERKE